MQKWIKKYLIALLIAPIGYILLLGYLYYDYIEHNRDVAELIKHLTETHIADILMHGMIFLAPVITTIIAILFQQTLTESQKKYETIINTIEGIVWEVDVKTFMFTFVSKQAEQLLGYPVKRWLNEPSFWKDHIHPEDRERTVAFRINQAKEKKDHESEYRMIASDGSIKWIRDIVSVILQNGEASKLRGIMVDITERKKAEQKIENLNRVYSILSKINETIVRVHDQKQLFEDVCRIAVEKGLFRMSWIGLTEPDTSLLKPVAHFGVDEGYLDIVRITSSDTHEGRGPTGRAVREGEHFICNDIEHEEYMLPWRDEALKRGYRSSAAFPIIVEKHVIGVINFYSTEASFFNEEEIKLLFDVAEDLSFAVAFIEGEKIRRQAEKELENRITELEKFYEMAIGRELKMKELKEEIARLKTELEKYKKGGEIAGGANQ